MLHVLFPLVKDPSAAHRYTCCSVRLLSKHSVPLSLSLSLNKAAVGPNGRLALETGLSRIATSAYRLSQPSALCPESLTEENVSRPGTFFKPPVIRSSVHGSPNGSGFYFRHTSTEVWRRQTEDGAVNMQSMCNRTSMKTAETDSICGQYCYKPVLQSSRCLA